MASRSQRRRKAAQRKNDILAGIAQAARSAQVSAIVRRNLASPIIHTAWEKVPTSLALCERAGASRGSSFRASVDNREKPRKRWS